MEHVQQVDEASDNRATYSTWAAEKLQYHADIMEGVEDLSDFM